jgi:hypothetical protein
MLSPTGEINVLDKYLKLGACAFAYVCMLFLPTDMISDIVRLALKMKNHEAAIQRAGAGALCMVRRQTKVVFALRRMYSQKCCGPGPGKRPELKKDGRP